MPQLVVVVEFFVAQRQPVDALIDRSLMSKDTYPTVSFVSAGMLAKDWDSSRTTVTRRLEQAGVKAYFFRTERNATRRHLRKDVDDSLAGLTRSE